MPTQQNTNTYQVAFSRPFIIVIHVHQRLLYCVLFFSPIHNTVFYSTYEGCGSVSFITLFPIPSTTHLMWGCLLFRCCRSIIVIAIWGLSVGWLLAQRWEDIGCCHFSRRQYGGMRTASSFLYHTSTDMDGRTTTNNSGHWLLSTTALLSSSFMSDKKVLGDEKNVDWVWVQRASLNIKTNEQY